MKKFNIFSISIGLLAGLALAGEGGQCGWKGADASEKSPLKSAEIQTGKVDLSEKYLAIGQIELLQLIEKGQVVLVDANPPESYVSGHIPGAVNYSKRTGKFYGALPEDRNALLVAYCGGPGCQAWCGAAEELENLGYKNIRHYPGGIKEWKSAGLKVEKKAREAG